MVVSIKNSRYQIDAFEGIECTHGGNIKLTGSVHEIPFRIPRWVIFSLVGAGLFSSAMNLLALVGPLFMLEVYDRVIPSQSLPTLVSLVLIVGCIWAASGLLDIIRGRILVRSAAVLDTVLATRVVAAVAGSPLKTDATGDVLGPVHDMDQIRSFLAGPGPAALLDLPWVPLYLAVCFFLHPTIGALTLAAIVILICLTLATDLFTRSRTSEAAGAITRRNRLMEGTNRNAEAVAAMGMVPRIEERWHETHASFTDLQCRTTDISGSFAGVSRTIRHIVQSGSLALGAYLVIVGEMTAGMIVAASIIVARALQPIEQAIGNWRSMLAARHAWHRLRDVLSLFPEALPRTSLPLPTQFLAVEGIFVSPPGQSRPVVQNVSFRAQAGTVVGIVGSSAAGKSSLVRAIVGIWSPSRGHVRLDGASLDQWTVEQRGKLFGYMPQSSDLLSGTIAENIARLDRQADHTAIVAAAKAAGAHEMIVSFPNGYETMVGDNGANLSAGQRQRISLARALFDDPFLLVLDEPNSNLDADGDRALADAIAAVRARGGIVIIVAHRNSILSQLDYLLVMERGLATAYGPRDAVLQSLQSQKTKSHRAAPALTVIGGEGV